MGCTRQTAQPMSGASLAGASVGGFLSASPFMLLLGFASGAFIAWNYVLPKQRSGGMSGSRRHRRRRR